MWSMAVYDFGLTTEEFMCMVPRQFFALMDRRDSELERQNLLMAGVQMLIANAFIKKDDKGKESWTLKDFMPEGWEPPKKDAEQPKEQGLDWQSLLKTAEQLNTVFGGKDLRKKKKG